MKKPLLEVNNLRKNFGGLSAINNLNVCVEESEIRGLIGPNGSGKTTFFNVITGYYTPSSGIVRFGGIEIHKMKPNEVAKLGMVRTFQLTTLFHEMTVLQNVYLGFHLQRKSGFFPTVLDALSSRNEENEILRRGQQLLNFLGIDDFEHELAKNLSHGHQRRLGIAIALAASPRLLLLDEPLTGMNPTEARNIVDQIRKIRDEMNISIIIVEHNIRAILGLCDNVTVLNYGEKIFEGAPKEAVEDKKVIEAYLGTDEDIEHVF